MFAPAELLCRHRFWHAGSRHACALARPRVHSGYGVAPSPCVDADLVTVSISASASGRSHSAIVALQRNNIAFECNNCTVETLLLLL